MKEKNCCWRALWLTEGSAALAVKEDVTERPEQRDIKVYRSADERNAALDAEDSAREEERTVAEGSWGRAVSAGKEEKDETEVPWEGERTASEVSREGAASAREEEKAEAEVPWKGERTAAEVSREWEHFAQEEKKTAAGALRESVDSAQEEEEHPEEMPYFEDEGEEMQEYDGLPIEGKMMCGMAALLEEYLLLLAAGIQAELTPPVTLLFIWITLAVISAEAVKLSAGQ